jgi:hypothetical protein
VGNLDARESTSLKRGRLWTLPLVSAPPI